MMHKEKSPFDAFSGQQMFIFGIVGGFLVVCTVGFFILLNMFLGGGGEFGDVVKPGKNAALVQPSGGNGAAPAAPTPSGTVEEVDRKSDHIRGNEKAKYTLVEYSDFDCPFCQRFHETMKEVIKDRDDVNWVYRHFPLTSLHRHAEVKAVASECAADQGKFWEFADILFENQGAAPERLADFAKDAGVKDIGEFEKCLSDNKFAGDVTSDSNEARSVGGSGTPHTVLVDEDGNVLTVVRGAQPLENVKSILEQAIK